VVHRQPSHVQTPPNSTFVHQEFHGIHLGIFVGFSNPYISKTTNLIFSKNSPPSNLAMSWCTANFGHVQSPPNPKLSCTNNFMVFILGKFVSLSNPHISKTTNFIFSQNSPPTNQVMPWCTDKLGMCKPLRTQNFRVPRILWYSFRDICRPFQPSHLKNH